MLHSLQDQYSIIWRYFHRHRPGTGNLMHDREDKLSCMQYNTKCWNSEDLPTNNIESVHISSAFARLCRRRTCLRALPVSITVHAAAEECDRSDSPIAVPISVRILTFASGHASSCPCELPKSYENLLLRQFRCFSSPVSLSASSLAKAQGLIVLASSISAADGGGDSKTGLSKAQHTQMCRPLL